MRTDLLALIPGRVAVRSRVRRTLHAALSRLPLGVLLPLRSWYTSARPGSSRERLLASVLEVVRLRGIPTETFRLPDDPSVVFARADSLILERAYWMGQKGYERPLLAWWQLFCRRSATVVEIGANVGYYTVHGALAAPLTRFVAVEPHPFSATVLRRNLEVNCLTNVEVVEAAVTDGHGPARLELAMPVVDHFPSPAGAFVASRSEISHLYDGVTTIEVDAVDVRGIAGDVDLIKVDAEGMEGEILSGLAALIRQRKPTMIVELLDGAPRLRSLVVDLCTAEGYGMYVPTLRGLVQVEAGSIATISVERCFRARDVILCPDRLPAQDVVA